MEDERARLIMPLHPKRQDGVSFFMASGLGGHALSAQVLTSRVPEPWIGRGLLYPSFVAEEPSYRTFEGMAERLIVEIFRSQAEGPYLFVGYSMGGLLCVELARQVIRHGHRAGIVLVDVKLFQHAPLKPFFTRWPRKAYWMARDAWTRFTQRRSKRNARMAAQRRLSHEGGMQSDLPPPFARAIADGRAALDAYQLTPVDAPTVLIRCSELAWWDALRNWPADYGWSRYTDHRAVLVSPGDHLGMIQGPNLVPIGAAMGQALSIVHAAALEYPVSQRGVDIQPSSRRSAHEERSEG